MHTGIEAKSSGEGPEGAGRRRCSPGTAGDRVLSQRGEIAGAVVVAQVVHTPNQLDYIAAALAAGEAMPEVLGQVGDKGVGVIAAMHRARPDEAVAVVCQGGAQALGDEHLLERNEALESREV